MGLFVSALEEEVLSGGSPVVLDTGPMKDMTTTCSLPLKLMLLFIWSVSPHHQRFAGVTKP